MEGGTLQSTTYPSSILIITINKKRRDDMNKREAIIDELADGRFQIEEEDTCLMISIPRIGVTRKLFMYSPRDGETQWYFQIDGLVCQSSSTFFNFNNKRHLATHIQLWAARFRTRFRRAKKTVNQILDEMAKGNFEIEKKRSGKRYIHFPELNETRRLYVTFLDDNFIKWSFQMRNTRFQSERKNRFGQPLDTFLKVNIKDWAARRLAKEKQNPA